VEGRGFFASLFDWSFQSLVTPMLIKVLYVLITIIIAFTAIGFIIAAFVEDVGLGLLTLFILAPVGALLYLILARVYLELLVVIFRIRESADELVRLNRQ
jgi:Domain of unknown function (DUF4282)